MENNILSIDDILRDPQTTQNLELTVVDTNTEDKKLKKSLDSNSKLKELDNEILVLKQKLFDPNNIFEYNPLGRAVGYKYDSSETGTQFERYYTDLPRVQQKLGYNPWKDNEAEFSKESTWVEDFSRSLKYTKQLANSAFVSMLPGNVWDGETTDLEASNAMLKSNILGRSSKTGFGGGFNDLIVSSGFTIGMGAEFLMEELIVGAVTSAAAAPTVGGSWTLFGANLTRQLVKMKKLKNITKAATYIKLMEQSVKALDNIRDINKAREVFSAVNAKRLGLSILDKVTPSSVKFIKDTYNLKRAGQSINSLAHVTKGVGDFYRDVRIVAGSVAESKIEGGMATIDFINNRVNKIYDEEDRMPSAKEYENIYETADELGNRVFWANMPAIYVSNLIVLEKSFKGLPGMKDYRKKVLMDGGKEVTYDMSKKAGEQFVVGKTGYRASVSKFFKEGGYKPKNLSKNLLRSFVNYTGKNLTEGFQELYQEQISAAFTNRYEKIFEDPLYAELSDAWSDLIIPALDGSDALKVFTSGFAMGGLMQGPQHLVYNKLPSKFLDLISKKSFSKLNAERTANAQKYANKMNELTKDMSKFHNSILLSATKLKQLQDDGMEALGKNDDYQYVNVEDEIIFEGLQAVIQSGRTDMFLSYLDDMKNLSEEELKQAFGEPGDDTDATTYYNKQINSLKEKLGYIKKRDEYIRGKFINPYKPERYDPKTQSDEYTLERIRYDAFETALSLAVLGDYSFTRAQKRMKNLMTTFTKSFDFQGVSASKVSLLMNTDNIDQELESIKLEIKSYEDKGESERKIDRLHYKLEGLNSFKKALAQLDENAELFHKEGMIGMDASVAKRRKMAGIKPGATVTFSDGSTVKVLNITPQYVITDRGKYHYKDFAADETDYITRTYDDLYAAFHDYISELTDDEHILEEDMEKAFAQLLDFYLLKGDQREMAKVVDMMHNPLYFKELVEINTQSLQRVHTSRKQVFIKAWEAKQFTQDINDFINSLYGLGMYFDIDNIDLLKQGQIPAIFDITNNKPVNAKHKNFKALEAVIKAFDDVADSYLSKSKPDYTGKDFEGRTKRQNDKRTLKDLANEFGFSEKGETIRNVVSLLETIIKSKFLSKSQKELAKALLNSKNFDKNMNIKFNTEYHSPGTYDKQNGIIINPLFTSEDYHGIYPIEQVLLKQIMSQTALTQLNSDENFKKEIEKLYNETLIRITESLKSHYGFRDLETFIVEAMTNAKFQRILDSQKTTEISSLDRNTVWSKFLTTIKDMVSRMFMNVDKKTSEVSVLDSAINIVGNTLTNDQIIIKKEQSAAPALEVVEPTPTSDKSKEPFTFKPENVHVSEPFTNATPIQNMDRELVEQLLSTYKEQNKTRIATGKTPLDANIYKRSDDEIILTPQFVTFVKANLGSVSITINSYNIKSGRIKISNQQLTVEERETLKSAGLSDTFINERDIDTLRDIIKTIIKSKSEVQEEEIVSSYFENISNQINNAKTPAEVDEIVEKIDYPKLLKEGLNGDVVDELISKRLETLVKNPEFDDIQIGNVVSLRNIPTSKAFGKYMKVEKISETEITLKSFYGNTNATLVIPKDKFNAMIENVLLDGVPEAMYENKITEEHQELNKKDNTVLNEIQDNEVDSAAQDALNKDIESVKNMFKNNINRKC